MKKKLCVGIAYDVKEDYSISAEGFSHCDFSMLFEIKMIKELLEERGHVVYLLGNYQKINKMFMDGTFPEVEPGIYPRSNGQKPWSFFLGKRCSRSGTPCCGDGTSG